MNKRIRLRGLLICFLVAMGVLTASGVWAVYCEDTKMTDTLPIRCVVMAVEYPGVRIAPGADVSMDIIFYNKGQANEDVDVWIARQPKGWNARIYTYHFGVTAVHVPWDSEEVLGFEAESPQDTKPGEYGFRIEARTKDGKFKMGRDIVVTVDKDAQKVPNEDVKADDERLGKPVELRVSVKASAVWGWICIAIIVAVLGGLIGVFRLVGKR